MRKKYLTDVTNTGGYYNFINDNLMKNPYMFLAVALVFLFYFYFIRYLGNINSSIDGNESNSMTILKIIVTIIVFLVLFSVVLQYIFNVDIQVGLRNIFKKIPIIDVNILNNFGKKILRDGEKIVEKEVKNLEPDSPEVFNIPDNIYSYDDAKALCKAYDSKLATYNQIEQAYNEGGEWCSYGWSSDQMILFPTQKHTYKKLQTIKGHEHDCGRPGINGGYIGNKEAKFGVNCFGIKPDITKREKAYMKRNKIYPDSKEDRCERNKVNKFKKYIGKIIISPFNKNNWNN